MKPGWTVPLALGAMSLLFFITAAAPLIDQILWGFGTPSLILGIVPLITWNTPLFAFIGFCAGIIYLGATRDENPSWYLGLPLVLGYAFIAFSPFIFTTFPLRDPDLPFSAPLHVIALVSVYGTFLLPSCALLFFWSQRQVGRGRIVLVAIAVIITLNSIAFWISFMHLSLVAYGLLPAQQPMFAEGLPVKTDGEGIVFLVAHILFGLPVLGLCLIILAAHSRYTSRRAAPPYPPGVVQ